MALGECCAVNPTRCVMTDREHFAFSKFGLSSQLSERFIAATFRKTVIEISLLGRREKVSWVAAQAVVASMRNDDPVIWPVFSIRQRPMNRGIREPMRGLNRVPICVTPETHESVPTTVFEVSPVPSFIGTSASNS
jgi:hypothetical protein